MSLQLYQVDQKNYLLDFKSLDIADHPDAARVKRMTIASMTGSGDEPAGAYCVYVCMYVCVLVSLSVCVPDLLLKLPEPGVCDCQSQ